MIEILNILILNLFDRLVICPLEFLPQKGSDHFPLKTEVIVDKNRGAIWAGGEGDLKYLIIKPRMILKVEF